MTDLTSSNIGHDATLWLLIGFSAVTWALLVVKAFQHWRASRGNRRYSRAFWAAKHLSDASRIEPSGSPVARLAGAGFNALRDGANAGGHDLEHSGDRHDLLERYLRQQIHKERRALDAGLAVLASIGSTAPFVGLFGTVWGIMHALKAIGSSGSASLDVVAGPIGDALVATGIGIAVAVPAVLAFNFFQRRGKAVHADLDDFATDFITLAQRTSFRIQAPADKAKATPGNAPGNAAAAANDRGQGGASGQEVFA